jgi:hypothetical protein
MDAGDDGKKIIVQEIKMIGRSIDPCSDDCPGLATRVPTPKSSGTVSFFKCVAHVDSQLCAGRSVATHSFVVSKLATL